MTVLILVAILICQSSAQFAGDIASTPVQNTHTDNVAKSVKRATNINDYVSSATFNLTEDGRLDFKGLAAKFIQPAEEYDIVTDDGYILKLFRVKGRTNKVVLLSHGFLDSSDTFLLRGKTSLIYMLVKEGFDVWAINYRGNRYSRRHQTLNPDINTLFWEYSMHEFGYYDLAAAIDFILAKTGQEKLSIVGHSEGSAAGFVLTSERPEYNSKINIFVATAPACYVSNCGTGAKTLFKLGSVSGDIITAFGINELIGHDSVTQKLLAILCSKGEAGYNACMTGLISSLSGYGPENTEPKFFNTVLGHWPAGTSRKNFLHYVQLGNSGEFARYNYGSLNNVDATKATAYDLSKVTCKVALIGARNDKLVSVKDVGILEQQLPNVVFKYFVNYDKFTHFDFIWGRNAHTYAYKQIIHFLNKYK